MMHQIIYKLYPNVTVIRGDIAFDADGNIVEWDANLVAIEQTKETKRQEALAYLASTDYKMTSDYDKDTTDVKALRANARAILRGEV